MKLQQYSIRKIVSSNSQTKHGVTIPSEVVAMFGTETKFFIQVSGNCITMISGNSIIPTKQELNEFDINKLRI